MTKILVVDCKPSITKFVSAYLKLGHRADDRETSRRSTWWAKLGGVKGRGAGEHVYGQFEDRKKDGADLFSFPNLELFFIEPLH